MPDVSETGEAFDVHGRRIAVGRDSGAVYLDTGLHRYLFTGAELENLREAVDRAAMPGVSARFGEPPADCDAEQFGEHPSVLDGHCRCMVCARCGHHAASNHQGHYWTWCSVTGSMREPHFCCKDPAFGCELEQPAAETATS